MKHSMYAVIFLLLFTVGGCAPVVVGAGATGAYKVATDERTTGNMVDDVTISAKINAKMVEDPDVKARKIDVDTVDGVVFLNGVVESSKELVRAEEIAKSIPGVKDVKNNLQVGSRTWGKALDDQLLGSKIKTALIAESGIRSLNIDVDVYQGVVSLTGMVDTREQKERAVKIARTTKGTVRVIDNITLKKQ